MDEMYKIEYLVAMERFWSILFFRDYLLRGSLKVYNIKLL